MSVDQAKIVELLVWTRTMSIKTWTGKATKDALAHFMARSDLDEDIAELEALPPTPAIIPAPVSAPIAAPLEEVGAGQDQVQVKDKLCHSMWRDTECPDANGTCSLAHIIQRREGCWDWHARSGTKRQSQPRPLRKAAGNGLIMNASKTQLMLGGKVRRAVLVDFHVVVDGVTVFPDKKLELLGIKFHSSLSTFPHGASLAASARQRAAMIAGLSHHLPRGANLQQLARGLVLGKRASLSSLNELTVHAVAMETWRAFHSQDGPDGSRTAFGQVLFPSNVATRSTRSEAAGVVSPHLPYAANNLVDNGIAMWNKFPALREASTKRMASNDVSTILLNFARKEFYKNELHQEMLLRSPRLQALRPSLHNMVVGQISQMPLLKRHFSKDALQFFLSTSDHLKTLSDSQTFLFKLLDRRGQEGQVAFDEGQVICKGRTLHNGQVGANAQVDSLRSSTFGKARITSFNSVPSLRGTKRDLSEKVGISVPPQD
eukprot:maker-scaffold351_size199180-snap-gene-0.34 protein:Tk02219 transcript:maker-scaffold351_size199180-snap-gene-0.34-mRNA-1 annotation:"rna-directed dna polymerase from mobile element jockey-like"